MTQSQSINSVREKNAFKPVGSYALLPTQFSLASVSHDFDLDTQYNIKAAQTLLA